MKDFEDALTRVVETLVTTGVDESAFANAVTQMGRDAYADLYDAEANTRRLRMRAAIRSIYHQGWLDQFAPEIKLLRAADTALDAAVDALLTATMARRDGWYTTPDDPWKSHVVADGGIVDREELRRHVARMMASTGPKRVLLINGDGEVGKSFSSQLLEVVAKRRGHRIASVDLVRWDIADVGGAGAREIAQSLATQLGLEHPTPPDEKNYTTTESRAAAWANELADLIRSKRSGETPWLFIDHLDTAASKRTEVMPFIHTLAYRAAVERANFRLVVTARKLDQKDALGAPAAKRALAEGVKLIQDTHITNYFLDLARHVGRPAMDQAAAEAACQEVLALVEEDITDLPYHLWKVATKHLKD